MKLLLSKALSFSAIQTTAPAPLFRGVLSITEKILIILLSGAAVFLISIGNS
jgi:hypothetical protein